MRNNLHEHPLNPLQSHIQKVHFFCHVIEVVHLCPSRQSMNRCLPDVLRDRYTFTLS